MENKQVTAHSPFSIFHSQLLLEQLQVDMNPDFFAYEKAAGFGRGIPDQTPMLAVDFG